MRNRLLDLLFWVVLGTLGFIAGIALMMMFEARAHAKEPPTYTCKEFIEPRIVCEAHYVDPFTPKWSVYLDWRLVEFDDGITVYLTIPQEWARVEVCVVNQCVRFQARWFQGEIQFKPHDKEE